MTSQRPNNLDPGEPQAMQKETEVGTNWWADHIANEVNPHKLQAFKNHLKNSLMEKYKGHWDPTNVMKGSGYRSITADTYRIDPLLVEACESAEINLEDFVRAVFKRGTDHIMFINPGEVRIRNGALLTTSSTIVWSAYPQNNLINHSSVTPSQGGGLNTPGGSVIHGVNMHNANVGPHGMGHGNNGTLSRGGMFTPTGQMQQQHHHNQPYMSTGGSQHGSFTSMSSSGMGGGHLHRNAIHAPAWTPMDNQSYQPTRKK